LPERAKGPKGQTDIAAALGLTSVFYKTWPNLGIQGRLHDYHFAYRQLEYQVQNPSIKLYG